MPAPEHPEVNMGHTDSTKQDVSQDSPKQWFTSVKKSQSETHSRLRMLKECANMQGYAYHRSLSPESRHPSTHSAPWRCNTDHPILISTWGNCLPFWGMEHLCVS
eukprot:1072237-Amphidinium_carterae.1